MKRTVLLTSLLLFSILTYGQLSFKGIVKGLESVGYSIDTDSKNTIKPSGNWYNTRAKATMFHGTVDTIPTAKLISITNYYIRGKKAILPRTYGRAAIQEWTFTDTTESNYALNCITKNNSIVLERIHKAPWTVLQSGNKLYFILTGGTYMRDELKKLESELRKGIEKEN
ncbi:hypothetical protein NAT51_14980 [Flavobacterium amniphilum]|uniref:hypothetical protein n=1 Tax=Flavobacterium amniphilum TaxID=1834035 RepID=UPI002029B6A9|nr:hypothetical protein [Flavobacterium amniphilum]MCL9806837.1 hypothetical protein [Flavobacterium amniphilum]